MTSAKVKVELQKYAKPEDAVFLQRFFKTGPGQYGEGDVFIGVRVPQTRLVARQFKDLPLNEVQKLLDSEVHEHRLVGLIILTLQYPKADETNKNTIYKFYIENTYAGRVNNWDLVDVTAPLIVGVHLVKRSREILYQLARSDDLWQRRVAILSSFAMIKRGQTDTTIELAEILLRDKQDLMHKAAGWMLREVGKRDLKALTDFLDKHAHEMPRTMLRYSLEKLTAEQKAKYMRQKLQT